MPSETRKLAFSQAELQAALVNYALRSDMKLPNANIDKVVVSDEGETTVRLELCGKPYAQAPFRYQVKCLSELRGRLRGLDDGSLARARPVLQATGCWDVLSTDTGV